MTSSPSTARAGNVVTLSRKVTDCPICGQYGAWMVEDARVCRDHVMDELERRYTANPFPSTPPLVLPARGPRTRGGAA